MRLQKKIGPNIVALTTSACFDFDYDIMPLGIFISIRKNFRPKGNVAAHTAISQELTPNKIFFKACQFIYHIFGGNYSFFNLQIVASSNSCRKFTYMKHLFLPKLFKEGKYTRAETIHENTVFSIKPLTESLNYYLSALQMKALIQQKY